MTPETRDCIAAAVRALRRERDYYRAAVAEPGGTYIALRRVANDRDAKARAVLNAARVSSLTHAA